MSFVKTVPDGDFLLAVLRHSRVFQKQALADNSIHFPVWNDALPGGKRRDTQFDRNDNASHTDRRRSRLRRVRNCFKPLGVICQGEVFGNADLFIPIV